MRSGRGHSEFAEACNRFTGKLPVTVNQAMAEGAQGADEPPALLAPPCGFPGCPAPEQNVRMQFIPSGFREREPGKEIRDGATSARTELRELSRICIGAALPMRRDDSG